MVAPGCLQPLGPGRFRAGLPDHPDAVQPLDLLLGQGPEGSFAFANLSLGLDPVTEAQTAQRFIAQRDFQIPMLGIVSAGCYKVVIPGGGQAVFQPLKEETAVLHLFDDLKPLGDDSLPFPVGVEPLDGGGHFFLQARDAGQAFKVVHHVQNQGRCRGTCCQGTADLLLVDDGRHRGPEQDHARDTFHMDALV